MSDIIYICKHNQVRSIIAHKLTEIMLKQQNSNLTVESYGLESPEKYSSIPTMLEEKLRPYCGNLQSRIPKILTYYTLNTEKKNIDEAQIILCMDEEQKKQIKEMLPNLENKLYVLSEYVNGQKMKDPKKEINKIFERRLYRLMPNQIKKIMYERHESKVYANCMSELIPMIKKALKTIKC